MYFQQVPLVINHDWERTKSVAQRLFDLKNHTTNISDYGNSTHYDFAHFGSLSDHKLSTKWYRIGGPAICNTMPWLIALRESLKALGPDDGVISCLEGAGAEHIDLPIIPSALNYVFDNSDTTAFTWVNDNGTVSMYPSEVNTAWILNTQIPHGIQNTGTRWTLSIHFKSTFDLVQEWFTGKDQLIFGDRI